MGCTAIEPIERKQNQRVKFTLDSTDVPQIDEVIEAF